MMLKPCPFCGGEAEAFVNRFRREWHVECYAEYNIDDFECCEARTATYPTKELAINAWNTRAEEKDK